jgi:hypothetical protein
MKTTAMTFRVDEPLRETFTRAARQVHRPVAQVLRELMRNFVAETATTATPVPSASELLRRRVAVSDARANLGLEGVRVDDDFARLTEQYAAGEIELDDLMRDTEARFGKYRVEP